MPTSPVAKESKALDPKSLVQFLVDEEGNVTEVSVPNADELHEEVVKESLRVFALAPKWHPATVNGKPVSSFHTQPLTFFRK